MEVKNIFYSCCQRIVGDGRKTRFWEDAWIKDKPLCLIFPRLYNLTFCKHVTVAKVFTLEFNCIRFRRCLHGETLDMWNKLLDMCGQVILSDKPDKVKWLLTNSGSFSVKSLYHYLIARQVVFPFKKLWRMKMPLKVKAFSWLVIKNRILTKDNLSKKGWKGAKFCEFCDCEESVNHLFFSCSLAKFLWNIVGCALGSQRAPMSFFDLCQNWLSSYTGKDRVVVLLGSAALLWSIWKTRNKSCFQSVMPSGSTDIIFLVCSLLDSWKNLQKRGVQSMLHQVSRRIVRVTRDIFRGGHGLAPHVRRIL